MDPQNNTQGMPVAGTPQVQPQTAPDIHKPISKADLIEAQRKAFVKRMRIFLLGFAVFIVILIVMAAARQMYIKNKKQFELKQDAEKNKTDVIIKEDVPETTENWQKYSNDTFRFIFEYPKDDKLDIYNESDEAYSAKVISTDVLPTESPNGFNLVKGYIYEVKPIAIAARNIKKIIEVKKEWFNEKCPSSAEISESYTTNISNIASSSFTVKNCNSDFVVSYVPANNYIFEIVQLYKGDIGFKQNYKLRTELMLKTTNINLIQAELPSYLEFEAKSQGYSFTYPRELDSTCCKVTVPPVSFVKTNIVLAAGGNDAVVGFFTTSIPDKQTYDTVLKNFENVITDDYKVIKGRPPEGTKFEVTYNGAKFTRFNDFSWKGNDYIVGYLPYSETVLIISIYGFPEDQLSQILNTLFLDAEK